MDKGKLETEDLLNSVLAFGQRMIKEQGEFYPYGMVLNNKLESVAAAAFEGDDHPSSSSVISFLEASMKKDAASGKIRASAIVSNVKITSPTTKKATDAIAVDLDHVEGYSVVVYLPYEIRDSVVEFKPLIAEPGQNQIFKQKR